MKVLASINKQNALTVLHECLVFMKIHGIQDKGLLQHFRGDPEIC